MHRDDLFHHYSLLWPTCAPGVDSLNDSLSVPCIGRLPIRFVESAITNEPVIALLYILS